MELLGTNESIIVIDGSSFGTRRPDGMAAKVEFGELVRVPRVHVSVAGLNANINPPHGNLNYQVRVTNVTRSFFEVDISWSHFSYVNSIDINYLLLA